MPLYQALSTKQPWANRIRTGRKTVETRPWATTYRGELLICASRVPAIPPCGCTICLVDLIDCRPMTAADWAAACIAPYDMAADLDPDEMPRASPFAQRHRRRTPRVIYGWHFANVRPVPPIPVRGQLRIFPLRLPDLCRHR